ncbi:MAG: hypothetical protein N3F67_03380 [Acidilobaceae archaeon]|nr:hypothetical protein [Acidilobaceae archaeon]
MMVKSFGALLALAVILLSLAAPASAQNNAEFRFYFKVPIRSQDYEMTSTSVFRQNAILTESQGKAPAASPLDLSLRLSLIINKRNETAKAAIDLFVNLFNRSDNRLNITLRLVGAADLIVRDPVKGSARFNISLRDQGALAARINLRAIAVDGAGNASLSFDERWFNASALAILESRSGNAVIDRAVAAFIYATLEELLANLSKWIITVNPKAKFSYNVSLAQNRVRVAVSLLFPYSNIDYQLQLAGIREYTSRTDLTLRFSSNRLEWSYKYSLTSPLKLGWEGSLNATAKRGVLEVSGNLRVAKENLDRARQNLAALTSVAVTRGVDGFMVPQGQLQLPAPPQINLNRIADNLELVVESVERATPTPTPSPAPAEGRGLMGLDSTMLAILAGIALVLVAGAILYYLGRRS